MMDKPYVRKLFDAIAYRYDLLNHLLSGGVDFYWRRAAIERLQDLRPERILDVATGTGDFAIAAMRLHPREIIGVDIAPNMLALGRRKIARRSMDTVISLRDGEAEQLPFGEQQFDAAIVAFGARNFENLRLGLQEMFRVLRPGGRIVVLEFSRPRRLPFRHIYLFYFKRILPVVGRLISGNTEAYTYLPDTVMRFPEGEEFLTILSNVGFTGLRETRLTFGIASIYAGDK
jgi:demethylmenaquinone methyltransferase / 2-methoxy-6-polyprenyl-1,4-benzoquinol methylase